MVARASRRYKWLVSDTSEVGFSELWRPAPETELDRLGVSLDDGAATGFDLRTFPRSTWLIHAMYETEMDSPASHDQREKQRIADGVELPTIVNNVNLSALTTTGVALGWSKSPGAAFKRLRWREYAERNSVPILRDGELPGHRGFGEAHTGDSWPENVAPPAEGSIDEESWCELVRVLLAHSSSGADTTCTTFYTPWTLTPESSSFLLQGRLGDAAALIDNPTSMGSPQNFWPDELDWFVYTDFDLQASRISGSIALIEALLSDAKLDCEDLPGLAK